MQFMPSFRTGKSQLYEEHHERCRHSPLRAAGRKREARTDCAVAEKNHADCIDELEQVKRENLVLKEKINGMEKN